MKLRLFIITAVVLLISCAKEIKTETSKKNSPATEISFYTPDSIQLFGDLYEVDKQGSTILLFHQGGSNARGEYFSIIPRLIEAGFNVLAIDQRMGGQAYGSYNRTLANIPTNRFGDGYTYCDAYNNLESALDFIIASGFTAKKILWGSSYSASLAIKLAHQKPADVQAVLAFSPAAGGPMQACNPNEYFQTLKTPLLLLRPPGEMENENSKAQFELAESYNHETYVPDHGVHGSSMLVEERVGDEVEACWKVVLAFLDKIEEA